MTLLVRSVQILGAERQITEKQDIFISGDKISAIGDFPHKKADQVLDGQGAYLTPGFIDVNTDSDHYLSIFDFPSQEDFLKQGVTTILGGHCGASLAPLLYGSLESIEKWTDIRKINVNWHTVSEFLELLSQRPLGVNFGTLIGHGTIRRAIVGEHPRANLTKNELAIFGLVLDRALKEGGFGMSSGLSYVHSRATPYRELKTLAGIIKEENGIYATHLRAGGRDLPSSVQETIKLAKETRVRTLISHFMPIVGEEKEYEECLKQIADLPQSVNLRFDIYPMKTGIWPLYTFLPVWAQKGSIKMMMENFKDKRMREKIAAELPLLDQKGFVVAQAPGNDLLVGYSLKDLIKLYSLKGYRETMIKLMMTTKLRATIFVDNISERLIASAIKNPRSFIASNAASLPERARGKIIKPERATSTFTKFLEMVAKGGFMSLPEAIEKITREPAEFIGLENRGTVREGAFADLVTLRGSEIKDVIVNGRVAVKDGIYQAVLAGKVLRYSS